MNIRNLFEEKKCVFSFEMFPPKKNSDDINAMYETIDGLKRLGPDYISITYGAGGSGGRGTERLAAAVKAAGIEPLAHLTCLGSGAAEIDGVLKRLRELGVTNVMALRGDRIDGVADGDFKYASELAAHIKSAYPEFNVAGACYPEGHVEAESRYEDIKNLRKKVEAGVTHLNSQLFFDNEDFLNSVSFFRWPALTCPFRRELCP